MQGFWETATTRFTLEEVDAAEAVGGLLLLFVCLSMYSALFDQHSSTWVVQAQEMNRDVFGWQMSPAQVQPGLCPLLGLVIIRLLASLAQCIFKQLCAQSLFCFQQSRELQVPTAWSKPCCACRCRH